MTSPFSEMQARSTAMSMEDKYRDLVSAVQGVWGTDASVAPSLPKGLRYQYWRKCDEERCRVHWNKHTGTNPERGWVTIGPTLESSPIEHSQMINEKHMKPLPQYGWAGTGEGSELLRKDTRWNMILMKGGLIEFPRDQIIAYGWDKEPIVRQMRPDVMGVERFECPHGCSNRDWALDEPGQADAYKTHVRVVHPTVEGPAATAKALSGAVEDIIKGIAGGTPVSTAAVDPTVIAAVVAATIAALEANRSGTAPVAPVVATPASETVTGSAPTKTTVVKRRGRPSGKTPVITHPVVLNPLGDN